MMLSLSRPIFVLIAVASSAVAGSARAETLSDAVAYAYETNPGLQAQRAALRALDETYVQARGGYGLSASAQASETEYRLNLSGANGGVASARTQSAGLNLVQPLWTGGRVRARISEAEAQIRAGREQLRRDELDVLQRVVAAYVGVRRDLQLVQINRDTVSVLERQLSDAEAKAAVREITLTDVAQSKARLAQARSSLAVAQQAIGTSRAQFLGVVGQNPADLEPPPPLNNLPPGPDAAFEAAEQNNPQLLAAQYTEEGSRAAIAAAKAQAMPTINARADFQRGPYQPYLSTPIATTTVGSVTVAVPLVSAGQIGSAVRQASQTNNRDRLTVDDVRLQVVQAVSTAWEQLASFRKQLMTLQVEVEADEFAFYGVRQEERFALRSTIETLNAELELTNAQQNLVRARAAEYISRVQLLGTMGVLTPTTLSENVVLYDPTANFKQVRNKGSILPLELPARALDALLSPSIPGRRGPSIAVARPDQTGAGEALPAAPGPEVPVRSILEAVTDTRPSAPKPGEDIAPSSLKVPARARTPQSALP
jgi:S-layer protein transport system outer membrane protein